MKRFQPWSRIRVGAVPVIDAGPLTPTVTENDAMLRETNARQSGILIGAISGAIGGVVLTLISRGL